MASEQARAALAQFTIVLANEDQQSQHIKAGFEHWRKALTYEQYHETYYRERRAVWGRDGKLLTWVLVRRDDPQGEMYAGCEVYTRKGFVKPQGSERVEETHLYGIASVVTPKQHLRNGYATRLLCLLHHRLSPDSFALDSEWGALSPLSEVQAQLVPKAIGSVLWSDVGSTFYSRCAPAADREGWVVDDHRCQELVWDLSPAGAEKELPQGWEWIYPSSLASVGEELSIATRNKLETTDTKERSVFVFDPASEGTLHFVPGKGNWSRETDYESEPVGVRSTASSGDKTIVLFSVGMPSIGPRLLVTHVHNLLPDQLPDVLCALDIAGGMTGEEQGWAWDLDPSSALVRAWKEVRNARVGRREEIDGHLLGVAWYGPGKGELDEGPMWLWC